MEYVSILGSVFDLLKPEDKIRLQNMRNAINSPQSSVVDADAASSDKQLISRNQNTFSELFTPLEHNSSAGVFKPFGQNADKQKRYEIYMKLKDAKKEGNWNFSILKLTNSFHCRWLKYWIVDEFWKCQPSTMTEWEKQRECEEFQRSADIYKPLSHQMASRFVSAKYSDLDGPTPNIIAKPVTWIASIHGIPLVFNSKRNVQQTLIAKMVGVVGLCPRGERI